MHEPDFNALEMRLLKAGITPRHAHRAASEIYDHYDDLVNAALEGGASRRDAERAATRNLGSPDELVAAMRAQRSLRSWAYRYPRLAILIYPLACLAALPAKPVVVGVANAPLVTRWGASMLLAALFTATLLLVLQLSILFG